MSISSKVQNISSSSVSFLCLIFVNFLAGSSGGSSAGIIAGVVGGVIALAIIIMIGIYCYRQHTVSMMVTSYATSHKRLLTRGSSSSNVSGGVGRSASISSPVVGVSYHSANEDVSWPSAGGRRQRSETTTVLTPEMIGEYN